ncbi:ACP phosphodiesterase, partial [bacterium]|nr:ACP phosphodiesterase [bacterium]
DRKLRFHESAITKLMSDEPHVMVWKGIHNHLRADAFFHQSEFFKKTYDKIRPLLVRRIPVSHNARPFFLAHILVEMLTDHVLLKSNPSLADEFYNAMQSAHHDDIKKMIEHYFQKPLPGIENHFRIFLQERFLASYTSLEEIVHALNRVIRRTRQEPFDPGFVTVLSDCTVIIDQDFPIFINDIDYFRTHFFPY